jgi:hypothetical protein
MLRHLGGGAKFTGGRNGSCGRNGPCGTKFYAWSNDSADGNTDIAHGDDNTTIGHYARNNDSTEHNSVNAGYNANYSGYHDTKHHDTEYCQPEHNYSEHYHPDHKHPELDYAEHSYTWSAG